MRNPPQPHSNPRLSQADFIREFRELGPHALARKYNLDVRSVYRRRETLERKLKHQITGPPSVNQTRHNVSHPGRINLELKNGHALVGSDAHLWPGDMSTGWRGFLYFAKEYKPPIIVLNGDVLDFPQVSRHAKIAWEDWPSVEEEIKYSQGAVRYLEDAAPKRAELVWNLGNHDGRFETRLATVAPEFAKIHGFHLKDHFPNWRPSWSTWINDEVVIKHRFKGGVHAAHNNTIWAGKTIITGHLHSAKVTPFTDYNGTRYGVDTGCLADPNSQAFLAYTEDNPKNWRSAFVLLTFKDGKLLVPELVMVWDNDHVQFRGELIRV